tara:strand:- start:2190 stop:6911 length:4722 start_codon:yes stop_codon:yes gene_type:complete
MVKISLNPQTNLQQPTSTGIVGGGVKIDLNAIGTGGEKLPEQYAYDSMNFTNIYTDDISKYQKYNVPTTRYFNWNEERAQNQGTGEKWVNGLSKAGVTTLGAIAENTLGIVAGLGELATGGAYYDNFVGKSVDKWNDNMRESFPNFKTQAEEEMSTGQKLGTANFWADTVANGFGYSIGSLATIWMTSGLGLIGRGAKAMQLYNASKAVSNGTKIAQTIAAGSKTKGFVNALAMGEMGLYMSLAESSVEARETQKNVYEDLIAQELEIKGLKDVSQLSGSELKAIEDASYAAGNRNFLTQLPVLMGTNLLMFGKQVAGFKGATKVNKDIAFDASLNKVVSSVANQGKYRTAMSRLKPLGVGVVTEAGQEGWQFASNIMSSDYHTDKYFDAGTASFTSSLYKGIKETLGTQEGLESMLVGGLVGGGMSGVTSAVQSPYKQRQKQAELAASVINGGFLINVNNSMKSFSAQNKVALDMENARKAGDIKAFKDAQYKLIQYSGLAALESGGFDVFMQKLEDSKSLSDTDFAKMFGYNPEVAIDEQAGGRSKSEVIKNVQDKLKDFKKVYENVNEIFPSAPRTQGLNRMRMSKAERQAEDAVFNKRSNLRNELILSASGIENKMERLESIQKQMKTLLTETERINGIKLDTDVDLLLNPGEDLIEVEDGKYDAVDEVKLIAKEFEKINKQLVEKNALAAINPFSKLAEDYTSIFMDKSTAIDRYNKLSSSKYFQDLFEETVKANQTEAEQVNKEKQTKEDIDSAETSDQVKESVPPDADSNTKMDAKVKSKVLKKEEQEFLRKYLDLHRGEDYKEQLKKLQHIAGDPNGVTNLSPTERKGLEVAIKYLEDKIKKGKTNDTSEVIDEDVADEITMTEDNIVRAENNDAIADNTPNKRPVRKKGKVADDKRRTDPKPTSAGQLNVVSATNPNEVINVGTEADPNYKVPVDDNGNVIEPDPDKVDGKPILINPDLLLAEDIIGEIVEFEIVENDWWKSGEFRDPSFTEDWMHIPIYYKIGEAYVGKLEASTNEDRKAIVDKILKGELASTEISEIQSNNFNNTIDDTTAPYFHNPEDTFGKDDDILLGFTTITKEGDNLKYQWTLSDVSDIKNKNNELTMINVQVQKDVSPNSINQIGIVIKKENNPAGVARISIASTANLNATAQKAVLDALADKNYEQAQEIVANSDQRLSANTNPRYLEFNAFDNGSQYIVYASPTLGRLIRINENELTKALKTNENVTFHIVKEENEAFIGPKSDAAKSNINIAEDLAAFIATKKYHVDRAKANTEGIYTSPVTNITYPAADSNSKSGYQEYLFSSKELGDAAREEGSGYNSILTTDITKKGESMFNSPRVVFEKGDVLGETPGEVINDTKLAETSPEAPVDKIAALEQRREQAIKKINTRTDYSAEDKNYAKIEINQIYDEQLNILQTQREINQTGEAEEITKEFIKGNVTARITNKPKYIYEKEVIANAKGGLIELELIRGGRMPQGFAQLIDTSTGETIATSWRGSGSIFQSGKSTEEILEFILEGNTVSDIIGTSDLSSLVAPQQTSEVKKKKFKRGSKSKGIIDNLGENCK